MVPAAGAQQCRDFQKIVPVQCGGGLLFEIPPKLREDVAEAFAADQKTAQVALSGIQVRFETRDLRRGCYKLAVYFMKSCYCGRQMTRVSRPGSKYKYKSDINTRKV